MPRRPAPAAGRKPPTLPERRSPSPRKAAPRQAPGSVRSLERALDLLEALERLRAPTGVRALEEITRIPKATAQRLLDVLERRGYTQKQQGRYGLAVGTVRLARGFLAGDRLAAIAQPVLQQLTALSGETASLYVRQGFERILLQRVESPHPLRHHTPVGERLPLHLGASGQVLCGGMPDDQLRHYLESLGPVRLASGRPLGRKELWARCQQARERGYAIGVGERFDGVSSVAAPVARPGIGVVSALTVSGPSSRLSLPQMEQLSLAVRRAAAEIAEQLDRI